MNTLFISTNVTGDVSMEKTIRASYSELAQIMLIYQANAAGNIHGGEIMKLMDNAAGVCAIKHAGCNVVTARVDEIQFMRPIYVGNLVTCTSHLAYVGTSSMEVKVIVEVEDLASGEPRQQALSGYFTMIAMDKDGKPTQVPRLKAETAEDIALLEEGKARYLSNRKKRQAENS